MLPNKKVLQSKPAANGRFGASGAVARPKVCANLEVLLPVRTAVEAPPAPSRWDVARKRRGQCNLREEE